MTVSRIEPAGPRRRPSFGLAATLLGVPGAVVFLSPVLALVLFTAEFTVFLLVLAAAVFSPNEVVSERAFRLLRWMTGNPEPSDARP